MKKKLLYILTILLFVLIPKPIFAQEETTPTDETQADCIDLEAIYEEINNSSQAITGTKNSIDAVKKINTTASLMNIISVFLGDQIYCVKDEVAASKSTSLRSQGLFGMLNHANRAMAMIIPNIDAKDNLAQMFVPGYKENNSLLAQDAGYPGVPGKEPSDDDEKDANEKASKQKGIFENLLQEGVGDFGETVEIEEFEVEESTNQKVSGYNYLKDVIKLDKIWSQSLNIVYVLYVLIFIVVGFMIMFRKKLQGNVTVTFSRALPNLIISLILATFSFAIVGLIMDVGKIAMSVSRSVFVNIYEDMNEDPKNSDKLKIIETKDAWSLANDAFKKTREDTWIDDLTDKIPEPFADIVGGVVGGSGNSLGWEIARSGGLGLIYLYLDKTMPEVIKMTEIEKSVDFEIGAGGFVTAEILAPILAAIMWVVKNAAFIAKTGAQYVILGVLIKSLILIVISFYAAFKVFITLLTTYLKLFGNVILAPFQLLMGAIPGNTGQITNWFKSVVANSLIFVAVFTVINAFALIAVSINDPRQFNFFSNSGVLWPDIIMSLQSIIVIAGYLFASSMPKIINGALGVGANKSLMGAGDDMKQSMKKIPVVGGMFN